MLGQGLNVQVQGQFFFKDPWKQEDGRMPWIVVDGESRYQVGMIDDYDECEWVNVSSGTGSPGLSQTKSTEP